MSAIRIDPIVRRGGPILTPDTPIRRAVALLIEARAAAAVVLADDGSLAGIVTQKDCFKPALHASYHQEWRGCVIDHMSHNAITVDANNEIIRVAEMFIKHSHRVFPVRDGESIVGLLYRSDVLRVLTQIG